VADPITDATPDEIRKLAKEIHKLAVTRRGEEELSWAPKGVIPEEAFKTGEYARNLVKGGTLAQWQGLEASYSWIIEAFEAAITPEPSQFDSLITCMRDAAIALTGEKAVPIVTDGHEVSASANAAITGQAMTAQALVGSWSGYAASAFKADFLSQVPAVTANQALVAVSIGQAAKTSKFLYQRVRNELRDVASDTKIALQYLNRVAGVSGPSPAMALSAAAAITATAAACVPGPGWAMSLAILSAGAGFGKDIVDEVTGDDKPKQPRQNRYGIKGATVDDVLGQAADHIKRITVFRHSDEDKILAALIKNRNAITSQYPTQYGGTERNAFIAPRPKVADLPRDRQTLRTAFTAL
jgi:hypothetical protein